MTPPISVPDFPGGYRALHVTIVAHRELMDSRPNLGREGDWITHIIDPPLVFQELLLYPTHWDREVLDAFFAVPPIKKGPSIVLWIDAVNYRGAGLTLLTW